MRAVRTMEATVLGYTIERLDEYNDTGLLQSMRHEVLCPHTGAVLGSYPSRHAAERFVVAHELRAVEFPAQRNLAA